MKSLKCARNKGVHYYAEQLQSGLVITEEGSKQISILCDLSSLEPLRDLEVAGAAQCDPLSLGSSQLLFCMTNCFFCATNRFFCMKMLAFLVWASLK